MAMNRQLLKVYFLWIKRKYYKLLVNKSTYALFKTNNF